MKMPIKYRVMIAISVVSLVFTFFAGIFAEVRWTSLVKRLAISVVFFSAFGYIAGVYLERWLRSVTPNNARVKNLDIVTKPAEDDQEPFNPFTPDSFERIDRK